MTRRAILRPNLLVAIALGGAIGAIARYEIVKAVPVSTNGMPWGTFLVNQTGAFVLGAFLTIVIASGPRAALLRAFVAVGVLGAYTTFSSLAMETVLLIKNHHAALGVVYMLSTVVTGLAVALLGIAFGRAVTGRRR